MSCCRLLIGFVIGALIWQGLAAPAPAQSMSATVGPQQMLPSGSPAPYPSTPYPGTTTPSAAGQVSPPYDGSPAERVASALPSTIASSVYPTPADSGATYVPYGSGALDGSTASRPMDLNAYVERTLSSDDASWTWQLLPTGLLYKSYLAGGREPRFSSQWVHVRDQGWLWDVTLGGRVGIVRFGTENDLWAQGWQLDFEGAAFPRLDLEHERDLVCDDFRAGIPLTTRQGPWEAKFGYYHLSSHIGDEFMVRNGILSRINYVRESLVLGLAIYMNSSLRFYAESGYAFYIDGGAKPWEFQFGADFSPAEPTGIGGAPFFAINGHLREENDFGGNMTVQTGWQWRGRSGHLARVGMQYFNGMSDQYQFFNRFEEQIGIGLWYDY